MKKEYLCLAITLSMLFLSCQSKQEISEFVEIHPEKFIEKELKLSDIVEELEYIQFDTTRIVNPRWQIEMTDKYIFVAACDELLKYDRKGKFIQTIGSKGQGPGEFTSCTNIALDMKGERIFIKDWSQVLVYSFNGKFLSKLNIPLEGMVNIAYANGSLYGLSMVSFTKEQLPYLWIEVDGQTAEVLQKKANTGIEFETDEMTLRCNYVCNSTRGTLLYYNHLNDTIFRLGHAKDKVAYLFGQGNFRLTPQNCMNDEYHLKLNDIWDSERYLFVDYRMNNKKQLCIYDKVDNVFYNDADHQIENDMDGLLPFDLHSTYLINENSYMMQLVSADEMKEILLASDNPKRKSWAKNMEFDDNDILVLAKLKK